jgi:hypothetical protein
MGYDPTQYGKTLTGAPLHASPFSHKFGFDRNVKICTKTLSFGEADQFSQRIQQDYHYKLFLDDLPSASILRDKMNKEMPADYFHGIPIGKYDKTKHQAILYNHWDIIVITHDTMEGHHRIVGFEVEPYSIAEGAHRFANDPKSEPNN